MMHVMMRVVRCVTRCYGDGEVSCTLLSAWSGVMHVLVRVVRCDARYYYGGEV